MTNKLFLSMVLCSAAEINIMAQGTAEDYKNAFNVRSRYENKMTHGTVSVSPIHEDNADYFLYSVYDGKGKAWFKVNAITGEKESCEAPMPKRQRPEHVSGEKHHWMEVRDEKDGHAENPVNRNTFIIHKNNNLYLQDCIITDAKTNVTETPITKDGCDTCYYSSWGNWSTDGKS